MRELAAARRSTRRIRALVPDLQAAADGRRRLTLRQMNQRRLAVRNELVELRLIDAVITADRRGGRPHPQGAQIAAYLSDARALVADTERLTQTAESRTSLHGADLATSRHEAVAARAGKDRTHERDARRALATSENELVAAKRFLATAIADGKRLEGRLAGDKSIPGWVGRPRARSPAEGR